MVCPHISHNNQLRKYAGNLEKFHSTHLLWNDRSPFEINVTDWNKRLECVHQQSLISCESQPEVSIWTTDSVRDLQQIFFCYRFKFCCNSVNGNFVTCMHLAARKSFPQKIEKVSVKIMNIQENFKSIVLELNLNTVKTLKYRWNSAFQWLIFFVVPNWPLVAIGYNVDGTRSISSRQCWPNTWHFNIISYRRWLVKIFEIWIKFRPNWNYWTKYNCHNSNTDKNSF